MEKASSTRPSSHRVLVTDYAWEDLDMERRILGEVGAELIEAESQNEGELLSLVSDVVGILTCWVPVTGEMIERAERCRLIGRYGIGIDNIDIASATEAGVLITNVPTYCIEEVSDHAMALLLACARQVCLYDRAIKQGRYDLSLGVPIFRLRGKTVGIVGLGKIGKALCRKAQGFGLQVIAFDPYIPSQGSGEEAVKLVPFDQLLELSDFISIHSPLTVETRNMFDGPAFERMKRTAFLINTSRGAIVDIAALGKALEERQIAGAALDVLPEEPPGDQDYPLLQQPGLIATPHVAFYSEESLAELRTTAARQMADVLSGKKPQFIVNPQVLSRGNLRAKVRE